MAHKQLFYNTDEAEEGVRALQREAPAGLQRVPQAELVSELASGCLLVSTSQCCKEVSQVCIPHFPHVVPLADFERLRGSLDSFD